MEEFETLEEKKEKKKRKKCEEQDDDILPETGLYTPDGFIFYHTSADPLTRTQLKRASEHGLNLRSRKGFTIEESVQIFKNWKEFAENHKMKLEKAEEYVSAKKSDRHIRHHQEENHFWPKLCHGLPHRAADRVKLRAEWMMTRDFIKSLDWDNLEEEIAKKYYTYDEYEELTMQKAKKLFDRGYVTSHVAELLGISVPQATGMWQKLKGLEKRDDSVMVHSFFEMAVKFGFDLDKLRENLTSSDDVSFYLLEKSINVKEMSLKMHMSEQRIREFLKIYLKKIWEKYHENVENDERTEEEKLEEAMQIISAKPPLTEEQTLKAVEIMCQKIEKLETSYDLSKRNDIAELIRKNGITDFWCNMPEYQFIFYKICTSLMKPLEKNVFQHLRREFQFQIKLHILLWTLKRAEWDKMAVKENETRYEVVVRSELANPFVSKMTRKFLKNPEVAEWITEPRVFENGRYNRIRRRQLGVELFILFCRQKYGQKFKFPAKLRPLTSTSSCLIERLLNENQDSEDPNSEYLTSKEVKKAVETATNSKMLIKMPTKRILTKEESDLEDSEDSEDSGDSEDVEPLLEIARAKNTEWYEERMREIEKVLEMADPEKISRKMKKKSGNLDENDVNIEISEKIRRQKQALDRVSKKWKNQKKFKSKEFVETDDSSSDGDSGDSGDPEESEDVGSLKKSKKSKKRDSEGLEDSEDVTKSKKSKKRNSEGPEDLEDVGFSKKPKKTKKNDSEAPEDSEDVGRSEDGLEDSEDVETLEKHKKTEKNDFEVLDDSEDVGSLKKHKKSKKRDSEAVLENSDDLEDSEAVGRSKKHRKTKTHDSEDVGTSGKPKKLKNRDSEGLEDSEDVGGLKKRRKRDSEDVTKTEKSKLQDSEGLEDLEDSEDVGTSKKHKKSKKRDSETPEESEDVKVSKKHKKSKKKDPEGLEELDNSEDVGTSKKHEKSKKNYSEAVLDDSKFPEDDSENPEDSEDVETLKNHKKSKKRDSETPEKSEDVKKSKKSKQRDSEVLEDLDNSEDVGTSRKHKKSKKRDSQDVGTSRKLKKSKNRDSEASEEPHASEDRKSKKRRKAELLEDSGDHEDVGNLKNTKKRKEEDSEDVESSKKKKKKKRDSEAILE